ncbi:MAG: hypothetical protein ACREHC_02035 [Candidatus Levyibacteriota bacterium]
MLQSNIFKFVRANHEALSPFISAITEADKTLLEQTVSKFRPTSDNYEDSWGYVIQATRYGGFKWYDKKNGYLIFFGRKSDSESTIVVPSFFAEPKYLRTVISTIQASLKTQRTILKNINPSDIKTFARHGFRPYKNTEAWGIEARYDDQTYPQNIVDLKQVIDLKGKGYHNLRKILRKDANAIIRKYSDKDLKGVLKVFSSRDKSLLAHPLSGHGVFYLSHVMYPMADVDKYVILNKTTGEIIGFTAISKITPRNAAYVALLFKTECKIASIWGIYKTMVEIYNKGYDHINFGGSESEGTDTFVGRNFQPIRQIKKTHLIYDPK